MSDKESDQRETDLSGQTEDTAHGFDQTNGVVEGLEGDADTPEQVDKRTDSDGRIGFIPVPAPGSQMPGGIIPAAAEDTPDAEDPDTSAP